MTTARNRTNHAGFTLIELVVTMSILSIILLMAVQVTESSRTAIRISETKSVNDAISRRAFDQIARDLNQIVIREDARIEFKPKTGNDEFAFLTVNRGLTSSSNPGTRPVSLVSYDLIDDPAEGVILQRGSLGHDFDDGPSDALVLDPDKPFPDIPPANNQSVSRNVIRIEVEFLVEAAGVIERDTTAPVSSENLRGIVITLATLDDRNLRGIGPDRLPTIAGKFADATVSQDTLKSWTTTRDEIASSGLPGFSRDALQSIRCYQRTFLIP